MANAPSIKMFFPDLKQTTKVLWNLPGEKKKALRAALRREGEAIMTASKRLCPVDTGTLRSTGTVEGPKEAGNELFLILGYGGAAQGYAATVHEKPVPHRPPTQSKFLEQPFMEALAGMSDRFKAVLKEAVYKALGKI